MSKASEVKEGLSNLFREARVFGGLLRDYGKALRGEFADFDGKDVMIRELSEQLHDASAQRDEALERIQRILEAFKGWPFPYGRLQYVPDLTNGTDLPNRLLHFVEHAQKLVATNSELGGKLQTLEHEHAVAVGALKGAWKAPKRAPFGIKVLVCKKNGDFDIARRVDDLKGGWSKDLYDHDILAFLLLPPLPSKFREEVNVSEIVIEGSIAGSDS